MTKLSELIEQLYFAREQAAFQEEEEATRVIKFTAQANVQDLAMLDAVAAAFGQTRAAFTIELIHEAALELFHALNSIDGQIVAQQADKSIAEHYAKSGVNFFSEEYKQAVISHWARYAAAPVKGAE
jgi:hypothetical protein